MWIKFIEQKITELGVKKEELELVDLRWEDHQKMLVKKKRNKPWKMREFVIVLRGNLDKVKEDLAWAESWRN